MHENEIGTAIVHCAVHLHQDLGPRLLETVYEANSDCTWAGLSETGYRFSASS